jgi:putative acetyltransferase
MVAPEGWLCLAPVAVAPERQGRGIASRLVRHLIEALLDEGRTVVVLGNPSLYARAGFSAERAARLTSPYPIEATLIARPGTDVPEMRLVYAAAFEGV